MKLILLVIYNVDDILLQLTVRKKKKIKIKNIYSNKEHLLLHCVQTVHTCR